jgi:predicted O-methyltransferase YrrM
MKFKDVNWISDETLEVDGLTFDLSTTDYSKKTDENRIVLLKHRRLLDMYSELLAGSKVRNVLEFGTWEAGSPLYMAAVTDLEKYVGIDIRDPIDGAASYLEKFKDRVRIFYNTSQDDYEKVHKIIDENFNGPLDLVIDDASHQYLLTRRAFEIAFSRLRPGGLYIVEDWAWAHYATDHFDNYFKGQPALSNLAIDVALAVGSSTAIGSIEVLPFCLIITKAAEVPRDFTLDNLIRLRSPRALSRF